MRVAGVILGAALAVVPAAAVAALAPTASAQDLSRHPVAESAAWQSYLLEQGGPLVYPKAVRVVSGAASQVEDPDGLKATGGGVTTIHSTGMGTPRLELDLGVDTGGYVEVGITTTDGSTVHLGYSESHSMLTPNGDSGLYPVTSQQGVPFVTDVSLGTDDDPTARFDDISAAGDFRSPAIRGAERWISLQLQSAGTVSIDYVRIRATHLQASAADYAGHFLSSDDQLNRVWYASAHTWENDAITRPDGQFVAVDGAKRDRLLWIGDLVVENQTVQTVFRQGAGVIKRSLQAFSCQQDTSGIIASDSQIDVTCPDVPPTPMAAPSALPLPEYTASWVIALHDYALCSGDTDFARRMLPVARRAMAYFTGHLDANGVYSTPGNALNWHPFDPAAGEDSHTNATVYRGLLDLAELEQQVGAGKAAADADRAQAAALARNMVAHLWDPAARAFLLNSNDPLRNHTQDAQVEAVYAGVVTGDQATGALWFITDHLGTMYGVRNGEYDADPFMSNYISPYISGTELLARLSQHDATGALVLMRREWGHMVDTDPNSDVWEKVAFDGDIAGYTPQQLNSAPGANSVRGASSYAHGWSTGPVTALSGYVLGIRPTSPGYATWTVEPQPGDLTSAQGQSPTPHGAVVSRWIHAAAGRPDRPAAASLRAAAGSLVV
jgi:hypothetical protein